MQRNRKIKNFDILKGTLPITMACQINQVVCVCVFLSIFRPALVPPLKATTENDVEDYFQAVPNDNNDETDDDEDY